MRRLILAAALAGLALASGAARAQAPCGALVSRRLPHAAITAAVDVALGPRLYACKVSITSRPTTDSDIRLEVLIPEGEAWNGRFVQLGNGGFAGRIDEPALASLARAGYAAAATDDGHESADEADARWALGHPEKVVDYGWRAIKETTDLAKAVIRADRGAPARFAYFEGCSDGGREALIEAQRFPTDFNGVIAGAPGAWRDMIRLWTSEVQAESRPGGWLDPAALLILQKAALATCAGGGSFIADEQACRFDPAVVQCAPGHSVGCLTPAQVATAAAIYRGYVGPDGAVRLPGQSPGAEADPDGWTPWITASSPDRIDHALIYRFAQGVWGDFVEGDPSLDLRDVDLATTSAAEARVTRELAADDPDLTAFRAAGGKLIQWHGWNDPAIPARASIAYWRDVSRTMGRDVSVFYRLYLVPGMTHCGGGPGPGEVDWLGLMRTWVEQGQAPGGLVATSPSPAGASQRLCPYPTRPGAGGRCV